MGCRHWLAAWVFGLSGLLPAAEFFVSPSGDDRADGTLARPFRTLVRARDAVRGLKGARRSATVWLRGGVHRLDATFELTEADSGRAGAPVAYRAWQDETPVVSGLWTVPPSAWKVAADDRLPPSVRGAVWSADVRALGLDVSRPDSPCGFGRPPASYSIRGVYCNGRLLTLARHPNKGFLKTPAAVDETNRVFAAPSLDLRRWTPEAAPDLQAFGYWRELWADMTVPAAVDPKAGTVRLLTTSEWARPRPNMPYYLQNAPAALDAPGEWLLDRGTGLLFVCPRDGRKPADDVYEIARLDAPMVAIRRASHLVFSGLVFRGGRRHGLTADDASDVTVSGCVIRDFGGTGLLFSGCRGCRIRANVLHTFGHKAMEVSGGDRRTLTPSGNLVEANDVSDTGRAQHTYMHGVTLRGCGTVVARNWLHDLPSSALGISGNEHLVASNLVERVVLESDDQGGVDMWGDPTARGNRFLFNVWRDIGRGGEFVRCGQAAIRFDDAISGNLVYGNRFDNCSQGAFGAVQIHAGRDNVVRNNLFVRCKKAVSFSEWPQERWRAWFDRPNVRGMIASSGAGTPVFRARYPEFETTRDAPMANTVEGNVLVGHCRETELCSRMAAATRVRGNVRLDELPADLADVPGFAPLPPESAAGPGTEPDLERARRNDGCGIICAHEDVF